MAVNLSPVGGAAAQFFTNDGVPLAGGKLYTYLAGTTTPAATFTTSSGNIYHTNPIVLDSAGRVPNGGEIWLTDMVSYKFVLKDSNDVLIATYDNILGINSNFLSYSNQQYIAIATAGQTVFNLPFTYTPGTNSLSVYVDGVNQYGSGAAYSYVETNSTTVTFNAGLHLNAVVKFTTTQQQNASVSTATQIAYTPPFAGGQATNVSAKLSQYVSVKDFGAAGDGIADDTTAIQAAVTSLSANGGGVYFPAGVYRVTSAITLNKPGVFFGDGYATNIRSTSTTADTFTVTGAIQVHITQMRFTTSAAKTAGAFVNITATATGSRLSNFSMYGGFVGVRTQAVDQACVENGLIFDCVASTGVGVLIENSTNLTVRNVSCTNASQILAGVQVTKGGPIVLDDIVATNCTYGLYLLVGSGDSLNFLSVCNSIFTTCTRGISVSASAANITRLTFDTCQISSTTDAGAWFATPFGGAINGVRFDKCQIFSCAVNGINFTDAGSTNVSITNCNISNNTGNGIVTVANITGYSIQNCRITANTIYGIEIPAGTGNDIIITGNNLRNNTTANLRVLSTGASVVIDNNLGADEAWTAYTPTVTASSGTFTTLGTVVGRYQKIGRQLFITLSIPITTNGSAATAVIVTLPSGLTAASDCVIVGKELTAGLQLQGNILASGTTFRVTRYDNSYPGANGYKLILTGVIEVS